MLVLPLVFVVAAALLYWYVQSKTAALSKKIDDVNASLKRIGATMDGINESFDRMNDDVDSMNEE